MSIHPNYERPSIHVARQFLKQQKELLKEMDQYYKMLKEKKANNMRYSKRELAVMIRYTDLLLYITYKSQGLLDSFD